MAFVCEVSIYQVNYALCCFRIGVATAVVGLSACIGQLKYWTLKQQCLHTADVAHQPS